MPSLISNLYAFGEFRLNVQSRVLKRGTATVALTPKAFDVLLLLIQHSGELVSKDEIMRTVWPDSFVEESNLTQTVFMLRKALGETREEKFIGTVQGRGYRFVAEVRPGSLMSEPDTGTAKEPVPLNPTAVTNNRNGDGVTSERGSSEPSAADWNTHSSSNKRRVVAAVAIVAVALTSAVYFGWSRAQRQGATAGTRVMLAVLPFQNLTGDTAQDYFSDGLTEEMIAQLGNLDPQHLGVIARTSVMHYKNSQAPLITIGRELNVTYVIEGSVRRDADRVRITAQLIKTQDQSHVWAREYDRDLRGLLGLQSEISREIADEIEVTLGDQPAKPTAPAGSPQNYEAYDLYLRGQYFLNKRDAPDLEQAARYLQLAIAKDPNYARAYAELAGCYTLMGGYTEYPQSELMPKARAAVLRALQIDDKLAEAHTALALIVQNYDWDWHTAEREFRRAIDLNPNYATAHHWYAEHLMWRGRFEEALQESERARQLDPLSLIIATDNGAILYYARQHDRSIAKFHSVLEMDGNFQRAHLIRGPYVEKGMFAEALADTEILRPRLEVPIYWHWYWSWRAYIYGREGKLAESNQAIRELLIRNQKQDIDPSIIARAYAGSRDKENTLTWLEKSFSRHSTDLLSMKVEPAFDFLRDDPRFQQMLERVGLGR